MDNHEEILDALTAFGKNPNLQDIPSVLEQYLNCVANNGETLFPWSQLKPLILRKMELVIMDLRRNLASENIPTRPNVENVRFDVIHARIIDSLHKFNGAPFTIQRLCELLIDPKRHYKRSDKFMRGLEKNVLVVSTVDPFGRKVVSELGNKPVLNGILDINGSYPTRDTSLSVPLPPVPGWVNTPAATRSTMGATTMSSAVDVGNKTGADTNFTSGKDPDGIVTNSLATVSGTPVFSDQGDPLAVHSEEVIEETVVTMDTGEVNSVVTDGGEALADRDMEAGEIDDKDASSSFSSSSSSSEELSTSSDSIENGLRSSTSPLATNNNMNEVTPMDENRPWAAFAQDSKQQQDDPDPTSLSASSPQHPTLSSADASSSSSSPTTSLSTETQSSSLSASTTSRLEGDQQDECLDATSTPVSHHPSTSSDQSQQQSLVDESPSSADNADHSFGFDPTTATTVTITTSSTSPPQHKDDMTADKLISSSTSTIIQTPTTATTTTNNNSKNTPSVEVHTSSSVTCSSGSDGISVLQPTYAQVVASSTTDKTSSSSSSSVSPVQHISPYNTTESVPCDSVAGLERLVGSMEQSMSSSSSSSSSSVVCPSSSSSLPSSSHLSTVTSHNNSPSVVTTSFLPESSSAPIDSSLQTTSSPSSSQCVSSEEEEPASKRPRLSMDEEIMEEDCISTSVDSCRSEDAKEDKIDEVKKEGWGSVDSSCGEEEEERQQQRESSYQGDVQMDEEEGSVTTGDAASVVNIEDDKANGCIESTSGDGDDVVDGGKDEVDMSASVSDAEGQVSMSNPESSGVSTTDEDDNQTPQQAVNDAE